MDPSQFRIRSQPDAALLAAVGRPKALEQAISASERVQAHALAVALLQAQAMHRTKTIVPLDQPTGAEATDEVMAGPASAPEDSLTSLAINLPAEANELPASYTEEILPKEVSEASQEIIAASWLISTELPDPEEIVATTASKPVSPAAPVVELPAPVRRWWLLGLLALVAGGIAAVLNMVASWQVMLVWLGAAVGAGLYLLARPRRKLPRAKRP